MSKNHTPRSTPAFTLAIVGRPNVGKSTLFNRLVGKKLALVDDQPGVTRDLREGVARLGDLTFTVIDTAGLEEATDDSLPARMRRLTERAVDSADVCLFLLDGRAGVLAADHVFAEILRKRADHVILAVNKAEGRAADQGLSDAYELGLGEPLALSGEHGLGLDGLYYALQPLADRFVRERAITDESPATDEVTLDEDGEAVFTADPTKPMQIAIVGRPNAGKSTLVNRIIGEDRLLTGPEAGITRDAIAVDTIWGGRPFRIFDTAGMRRRAKVVEKLEKLSTGDSVRAIRFAEVVVVLLDVQNPFEQQDLRIVDLVEREGRGLVIGINKWDMEDAKTAKLSELREKLERLLPQVRGVPMVTLSGETGQGVDRLQKAIVQAYEVWNTRIPTAKLNRWLRETIDRNPPPALKGRRLKMRYITQNSARPPSFVVFGSRPDEVPESYQRYLINSLRQDFKLDGTPIRLNLRGSENPYDKG